LQATKKAKITIVNDGHGAFNLVAGFLQKTFEISSISLPQISPQTVEIEKPDLLFFDIKLPGVEAKNAIHSIRRIYSLIQLPVIVFSEKVDAKDIVETLYLGASDYFTKPLDFEIMLIKILTHLNIAEDSRKRSHRKETELLEAIVTTYNHEINNPMAVAIGSIQSLSRSHGEVEEFKQIERGFWRIANFLKEIERTSEKATVDFQQYANSSKMIKIK
jgi:DNA-binding response OmpR family regulator